MSKKPRIANVWWRGEWAWGRATYRGKEYREPLETKDPRDARQRVQEWLKRLKATNWGEKPRRTFDETASRFIDEHLPLLKGGTAGRTAKGYLAALNRLADHFEGRHLDEITSGPLSEFERARRAEGVTGGTIRGDLFVLSSMFTRAAEWEWSTGNPVAAYVRGRAKRGALVAQPPRTRYCSHQEEAELLARCRGSKTTRDGSAEVDHIMLAAAIALTIDIGLRKEELLGARWDQVDLERREWTVTAAQAKSSKARVVPIVARSEAILRALPRSHVVPFVIWHADRGRDQRYADILPAFQNVATGGRSSFARNAITGLGRPATAADRDRITAEAEAKAWADVIPDLVWHDLRRTCGCRLLQDRGFAMERVSAWLGHSSVKVTEAAYAFLDVRHLHEAAGTQHAAVTNLDSRPLLDDHSDGVSD